MKVHDFRVEPDGYSFRLASADEDQALVLLRQVVSPADLRWEPREGRWWLAPGYQVTLGRLIESFDRCLALARLGLADDLPAPPARAGDGLNRTEQD